MIRLCLTLFALVISASAHANIAGLTVSETTISWTDTGGWVQVQDSSDYRTICEGQITSCVVSAGTYQVIDHSNNNKSENVVVMGTPMMNMAMPYVIHHQCPVFDVEHGSSDTCESTCRNSDLALSVTCAAHGRDDFHNILPVAGDVYGNHAVCRANVGQAGLAEALVAMHVACMPGGSLVAD